MTLSHFSSFLRRALIADAAISGATGLMLLVGAGFLKDYLGLPVALLRYAGLSLLPFAAMLIYLASRSGLSIFAIRTIIAANVFWAVASIIILFTGWIQPTQLGYVFVIGQALIVAIFAEAQFFGLRRSVTNIA